MPGVDSLDYRHSKGEHETVVYLSAVVPLAVVLLRHERCLVSTKDNEQDVWHARHSL